MEPQHLLYVNFDTSSILLKYEFFKLLTRLKVTVPINVCASVLGAASCSQQTPSAGGLVSIPVDACLAVLGEVQCAASAVPADGSHASSSPLSLLNLPISVCAAIIGQVQCSQLPSTSGGLVR